MDYDTRLRVASVILPSLLIINRHTKSKEDSMIEAACLAVSLGRQITKLIREEEKESYSYKYGM